MTYKLDITLLKAEIEPHFVTPRNQVWFNLNCDGCKQPSSTPAVPMQKESVFNSPCSFIITTADTMTSYIYVTICCFGNTPNQMVPLGRARSRIGKLPLNPTTPSNFQIPLISVSEKDRKIATVLFYGTLAPLNQPGSGTYAGGQIPQPYQPGVPYNNPNMNPRISMTAGNGMPPMPYPGMGSAPGYPPMGGMPPYGQPLANGSGPGAIPSPYGQPPAPGAIPGTPYGQPLPNGSGPGAIPSPYGQPPAPGAIPGTPYGQPLPNGSGPGGYPQQPFQQPQPGSQGQMPPPGQGYPGPVPNQYGYNYPPQPANPSAQSPAGADQLNVGENQYYF